MRRLALVLIALLSILIASEGSVAEGSDQLYISVTINEDGSITPASAPVARVGENYQLTGDMGKLTIKRSGIVLDGNGYEFSGKVSFYEGLIEGYATELNSGGVYLMGVENVTVKNVTAKECKTAIYLDGTNRCVISNNTLIGTNAPLPLLQLTAGIFVWNGSLNSVKDNKLLNNYNGIQVAYNSDGNIITQNLIANSTNTGLAILDSTNNTIHQNRFVNNTIQASTDSLSNFWNTTQGNYWSDYNNQENDTYKIGPNNTDYHPLTETNPEKQTEQLPLWLIAATVIAGVILAASCLWVYLRKQRKPAA